MNLIIGCQKNHFDLIHCDIWGPYHVSSYTGYNYFLALVDDCSRFTWVYLSKQKSEARNVIPRFFNMISTQFNTTIKMFRSDNANELASTEFFAEKGVIHQFSCLERPQQNFVDERKHQHLLNVARSLYFQSRVPVKFWSECVLAATFLINRTPSPILRHRTPYEVLYGKPADYSMLRVFGCWAFAFHFNYTSN